MIRLFELQLTGFCFFFTDLKVGALWGSNLAEATTGNTEESLRVICSKRLYDTIVLNTLSDEANDQNKGWFTLSLLFIFLLISWTK